MSGREKGKFVLSRVGKIPVPIPEKTEVTIRDNEVSVKGPLGALNYSFSKKMKIEMVEKTVRVTSREETTEGKSLLGTTRSLINNMVIGVNKGFKKDLEFNGVGYKALVKGDTVVFNLGHSHPINYKLPQGITAKVVKNVISISGCNKELVGFVAAKIRSFRPPEPYKGKGVKYVDEVIIRKAGKTGSKKAG